MRARSRGCQKSGSATAPRSCGRASRASGRPNRTSSGWWARWAGSYSWGSSHWFGLLAARPRPQPSSLRRAHVQEPIAIDARRGRTPRVRRFGRQERSRELFEELLASIRQGALSQGGQRVDGVSIEVALRHRRVGLSLPAEEAPDVSPVFEQQRRGFVFRMALEEDEQAPALLHERVDARLG